MLDALWAGLLAGYAIAIPVGPITLLIVDIGLRRGLGTSSAAAAGAASADGLYATAAGVFGAALASAIAPVILPARLLGAGVLAYIGLRGLLSAARPVGERPGIGSHLGGSGPRRTYLLLLALTVSNPMTFVYFAALTLALPAAAGGLAEKLAFAAAAFAASLSWQLLLAVTGSLLHGRLPARAQVVTRAVGGLAVLAFAVRIAIEAVV